MKKRIASITICMTLLLLLLIACTSIALAASKEVVDGAFVNRSDLEDIAKVSNHAVDFSNWHWVKYETCTEDGVGYFTCDVGDTIHDHYIHILAHGHYWASESGDLDWGVVITPPYLY